MTDKQVETAVIKYIIEDTSVPKTYRAMFKRYLKWRENNERNFGFRGGDGVMKTMEVHFEEGQVVLVVTLPDIFVIRKALDAYKYTTKEQCTVVDLLTWLWNDFE